MAINFTRRVITSGHASVDDLNTNFSTLETAVSRGLSRYSDTPNAMQSTLDMNSNRIINLPNAISSTEPVTYGQWIANATATTLQGMPNQVLTATAGQTVFNFTSVSWGGADTVKVYVNGIRQFTGFSLTDNNTITFSYGLQVGDEVMAETLNFAASATTTTSNLVTHTPAGTGAVNRTVQSILRQSVYPEDYGAVGDGTTDDTAAVQAAITYGTHVIFNNTYLISSKLNLKSGLVLFSETGGSLKRSSTMNSLILLGDSGSALSNVSVVGLKFDNNSLASTAADINLTAGGSNIRITGNKWVNLTNKAADLIIIPSLAAKTSKVIFTDNTIIGPGSVTTYNTINVKDVDNFLASHNIIDGYGAIKAETSSASDPCRGWTISNNQFYQVDQTNIFCRVQNSASVVGVNISDNVIIDSGKAGIVVSCVGSGNLGTISAVSVNSNSIKGFSLDAANDAAADHGINIGGIISAATYYINDISVTGNTISGLKADGTSVSFQNRGINLSTGCQNFSITSNQVSDTGRSGISTTGARYGAVTGNTCRRCVTRDTASSPPTSSQEGGITIFPSTGWTSTDITVSGNVSMNNGVSGAVKSYGINLGPNSGGTVTNLLVYGNTCNDNQGTKTQDYGIRCGSTSNPGPTYSKIYGNRLLGNATGTLLMQGTITGTTIAPVAGGYINVQDFGALGDNSTDDTAAIQAALDYAGTIRGTVYVPATTSGYVFTNLTMYSSTGLIGDGMHQTLLNRKAGSTGTAIREKTAGEGNSGGATGIQIRDILIDGQGTTGDGINLGNQGGAQLNFCSSLQNVHVREFVGTGFDLNNNATACHYLWSNLSTVGFKIRGGSSNYHDLWAEANSNYGIDVLSSNNKFYGCYFEGDATYGTDTPFIHIGGVYQNVFFGVEMGQLARNFTKLIHLDTGSARNDFHNVVLSPGAYTVGSIIYSQAWAYGRGSHSDPIIKFWIDNDTNTGASPESYYFSSVTGRLGIIRGAGDRLTRSVYAVASASSITLPEGDIVSVTGTTGITSISATNQTGRLVVLKFADALTVTDGSNLKLNGNFTTTADDTLTVVCDGTNWYEVARSAN